MPCFGFLSEDSERTCHEISGIDHERAWRKTRDMLHQLMRIHIINDRRTRPLHRLRGGSSMTPS
jgi:hypothetical protein